jgi:hypothetical protein
VSHKRKKQPPPARVPPRPRFPVGTAVRVKPGVVDPNYPDIPLGGWAGVITEIDDDEAPTTYQVDWSPATLAAAHPVYRHRCERDELECGSTWLDEDELELDPGGPPALEQPTQLVPRSLNRDDPGDRVRALFGLTSDDPLPEVNAASLRRFREHLSERLQFPFPALHRADPSSVRLLVEPATVLSLLPFDEGDDALFVDVLIEGGDQEAVPLETVMPDPRSPGGRLVADYGFWVEQAPAEGRPEDAPAREPVHPLLQVVLVLVLAGAALGALLEAFYERTLLGAQVGAVIGGLLGVLISTALVRFQYRGVARLPAGLFGATAGAASGAVLGGLLTAPAYSLLGAVAGWVAGWCLRRWTFGEVRWAILGACAGGLVLAHQHADHALRAAAYGAGTALVGALLWVVLLAVYVGLAGVKE